MKPHIANTREARGVRDGSITQLRVPIVPQPPEFVGYFEERADGFKAYMAPGEPCDYKLTVPPYRPGDQLYFRETWCYKWRDDNGGFVDPPSFFYRADGDHVLHPDGDGKSPWCPSITMPRSAARTFPFVLTVRAQRVQDATADECRREGAVPITYNCDPTDLADYYKDAQRENWDAEHPRYPAAGNPWTWLYEIENREAMERA